MPNHLVKNTLISGAAISLATQLAALYRGRQEDLAPVATVNAPAKWLWGNHAVRQRTLSTRYTLTGYLIHHLASLIWGGAFEMLFGRQAERGRWGQAWRGAALVAVASFIADYLLAPPRLSPGWEKQLSARSLVLIYLPIALVLPLRGCLKHLEGGLHHHQVKDTQKGDKGQAAEANPNVEVALVLPG